MASNFNINFNELVNQSKVLADRLVEKTGGRTQAAIVGTAGGLVALTASYKIIKAITKKRYRSKPIASYKSANHDKVYNVAIVGAGPSGSCLGYYLSKKGVGDVLLLDKKKFPRDKYCGDAISTLAQRHLREMGVLQEIVSESKGHFSQSGGFVSPCGNSFIGNSAKELNLGNEGIVISIKRIVMDEKIAKAALKAGALLTEETAVEDAIYNKETGIWTVKCTRNEQPIEYHARVLVCADGAPSQLATKLGYIKCEPQGVCSRAYVKNNTHFKWDGVVFYPPRLLPGYCAIIREAGNELNFCTYIIPGGPTKNEDLPQMHDDIMKKDPFVSQCLGPNPEIERMRSASLRFGGTDQTFDDNLLIIGDAAGFIDPLTGEGIQYAMESGKIAAEVLAEGLQKGDVSAFQLQKYQDKWYHDFGADFWYSMKMALLLYRFPILLDAAAKLIEKRGSRFLSEWAEVMTGSKSKTWFLRPDVAPFIVLEIVAQFFRNITGRGRVNAVGSRVTTGN